MRIAIVGAGIGGLTAAIALERRGHEVTVLERAHGLNEVGAGITLWSNALRVLKALGVEGAVRERGERATGGVIALSDGRVLVDMTALPAAFTPPDLVALHRADLQEALYEPVKERVHFGRPVDDVAGIRDAYDLVVAADGLRSLSRRFVVGDDDALPRYSGYTCWRGVCEKPSSWRGPVGEFWGDGDRFGVVEIGRDRLYWFAVANSPPELGSRLERLERYSSYQFDVPAIIDATPRDAILHHDILDRPPARGWFRDEVVLLGDAAHPTTPNMGQGAAMAIESAIILARALDEPGALEDRLRRYEATRFDRTAGVTRTSWTLGKMAQTTNGLTKLARNAMFRFMPMKLRLAQVDKLAGYDAGTAALAGKD